MFAVSMIMRILGLVLVGLSFTFAEGIRQRFNLPQLIGGHGLDRIFLLMGVVVYVVGAILHYVYKIKQSRNKN